MRPLVGIPPCLDERGRWRPGRDYHYVAGAYAAAVDAAGGAPVYLPPQADPETLAERIDGLLVPGGGDFLPEAPYPDAVRFDPTPPAQLAFDRRLLAAALARGMPVLGICYGMQLLALHHGGTLLHDIETDAPESGPHQLEGTDARHGLVVEPGTRLADALRDVSDPVNSLHHQGVATPGRGLRACARAEDGLVEAIECEDHPFRIGVQWHPEQMQGPHRERLFAAFVSACRTPAGSLPSRCR